MLLDNVSYGHPDFTIIVECYYYVHYLMSVLSCILPYICYVANVHIRLTHIFCNNTFWEVLLISLKLIAFPFNIFSF